MPRIAANGIEIEYAIRGAEDAQPLLMINGLGTQLISWPDALLDGLAEAGFKVIVYDNRDSGLSTDFDSFGPADIPAAFKAARAKGAKLIVIDPKRTKIAEQADLYIQIAPGTDVVLAQALALCSECMDRTGRACTEVLV